jgi:hypothetical protein
MNREIGILVILKTGNLLAVTYISENRNWKIENSPSTHLSSLGLSATEIFRSGNW